MVFNIARGWNHFRHPKIISIALILLFSASSVCSAAEKNNFLTEVANNVTTISTTNNEKGIGLFLGTYEGKALLLAPAHVLSPISDIGNKNSPHSLSVSLYGAPTPLSFRFADCSLHLENTSTLQAMDDDYVIIEIPIGAKYRGAIFNLSADNFKKSPFYDSRALIFGKKINDIVSINNIKRNNGVVHFDFRSNIDVQSGDSGSVFISGNQILGIETDSGGRSGSAVYPEKEIKAALETIAWSKSNRKDYRGYSFAVAPSYQYSQTVQDLGSGVTKTNVEKGIYTSFEFEYLTNKSPAGHEDSSLNGFVLGYSSGSAHGLGQVDNADYTLKLGLVSGSLNRVRDNSGQMSIFVLSHMANGKFVHRLGVSLEADTPLWLDNDGAFDLGFRIEINKMTLSSDASAGLGLVFRYTKFRPL